MQVILKEDVHNLGRSGELVTVKPGYGRNYLIPQGLAMAATADNMQRIEHEKKVIAARNAKVLKDSQAMADRLAAVEVQIERQVGEGDKLFGSVTAADVVEAVQAQTGIELDRRKVHLADPIREVGQHTVTVKLHADVEFPVTVDVAKA